jgi:vitamin B12 transporter
MFVRRPATRAQPCLLTAALLLAPSLLAAQGQRDTVELEELVVTADRAPTPLARVVSPTTVITGEELRAQGVYFIQDALRQVPGAAVVSTGSYGGTTSLFLRGGESDYTKVLIDGVAVNAAGGAFNFGTLSTDNVDRIEIVRGPVSVLYGSDAVAGVVNVITKRGAGALRGEVTTQAGTFGTWRGEAGASGGSDQASYSVSLSRLRTDGTYRFNSGYTSTVGSGALSVRPDDRTDITLTARTGDNTFHFPTDFAGVPVDSNQRTLQNGTTLGLELGRRFTPVAELRVFLASNSQTDGADNAPDSPGDTTGVFASQSQSRSLRRSVDARGIFQATPHLRLTAGAQAEFESLREFSRSEFNFGGGPTLSADPPFSADRRNVGTYGQGVLDIGSRGLLNLGLRLDDNQQFGRHLTYRVGAVYVLTGGLRARGALGSAFKEPSIRENYARSAFEVGNPDLRPEQTTSWELGLEQSLAGGRVTLAANYFDQRFRNLIQYDGNATPGTPNYQNVARATSRGVELVGDVRPSRHVTLTASYTWLRTRVVDAGFNTAAGDVFVNGKELIRRPAHSARLGGRARLADRIGLGLGVNYFGRRDDVDFRPFPSVRATLPAYLMVDADASVDLLRERANRLHLAATIRVENLFDKSYETVIGFPGRGRAILAGARVGL